MSRLALDPDLSIWVPTLLPRGLDPGDLGLQGWADAMARSFWADGDPDPADLERIRQLLLVVGDQDYPPWDPTWLSKWLHCPTATDIPLAVCLSEIEPTDDGSDDELRFHLRVGDPSLIEEPIVEEVRTPLGPGLRALAYAPMPTADEGLRVSATLSYAWRVEYPDDGEVVVARLWTQWDPPRVLQAQDDLERLAESLQLVEDTALPAAGAPTP